MIAAFCTTYGDPELLRLAEVPTPNAKADEIRIRVVTTTVSSGDARVRALRLPKGFGWMGRPLFGFVRPRQPILGTDLAGIVDQVGDRAEGFSVGDEVFAQVGFSMGCHAEYRTLKASAAIARKPANLTWNETAAMPFGGTTALEFLRRARLKAGEILLVNGASGSVGSAAIQIAKAQGILVHGVCSARNTTLVQTLGCDAVIDSHNTNLESLPHRYDAILDTVGNLPYPRARGLLAQHGRLLSVAATLPQMLLAPWQTTKRGHSVVVGTPKQTAADLSELARLALRNQYRPVIDEIYPLAFIAEAHRRVDKGHKRGNVVVQVSEP